SFSHQGWFARRDLAGASHWEGWISDELEAAIMVLDERGAALHPVAAIVVIELADLADRSRMDVATQDGVNRKLLCVTNDRLLEFTYEVHRVLDSFFRVRAKRPITETEAAAEKVYRGIERKKKLVTNIAQKREPLGVLDNRVELVSVNNEHSSAI